MVLAGWREDIMIGLTQTIQVTYFIFWVVLLVVAVAVLALINCKVVVVEPLNDISTVDADTSDGLWSVCSVLHNDRPSLSSYL